MTDEPGVFHTGDQFLGLRPMAALLKRENLPIECGIGPGQYGSDLSDAGDGNGSGPDNSGFHRIVGRCRCLTGEDDKQRQQGSLE